MNSILELLTLTLNFFKQCPLPDTQIAARMSVHRSTLHDLKTIAKSIKAALESGSGPLQPLFPKGVLISALWAGRPQPVTQEYVLYMQYMDSLYDKAAEQMRVLKAPRRYSTTTSMRIAAKQREKTEDLPPLSLDLQESLSH